MSFALPSAPGGLMIAVPRLRGPAFAYRPRSPSAPDQGDEEKS